MNLLLLFILFILVQWCIPEFTQAKHTPQNSSSTIRDRMGEALQYTQYSVDICIHDFAALGIEEYLVNAKSRGARARVVILKHDNTPSKGPLATALIQKGFDVRVIKLPNKSHDNSIHQDFVILDDRILITGVYNWMAYRNRNINDYISFYYNKDKALVYKNKFYKLFAEGNNATIFFNQGEQKDTHFLPVSGFSAKTRDDKQYTEKISDPGEKTKISGTQLKEIKSKEPHKNFIDVSFEELNKLFGKESTLSGSEKKAQWEKYNGKYICWDGTVVYKGIGRVDWNRVGISHQGDEEKADADVVVLFNWKMYQKVMNISAGNIITYTGKLISRPRLNSHFLVQDGMIIE